MSLREWEAKHLLSFQVVFFEGLMMFAGNRGILWRVEDVREFPEVLTA